MPASLLESQFTALEEPDPGEKFVWEVPIEGTPEEIAKIAAGTLIN